MADETIKIGPSKPARVGKSTGSGGIKFGTREYLALSPYQQRLLHFEMQADAIVAMVENKSKSAAWGRDTLRALARKIKKNDRSLQQIAGAHGVINDIQNQAELRIINKEAEFDADLINERKEAQSKATQKLKDKRLRVLKETMLLPEETMKLRTVMGEAPLRDDKVLGGLISAIENSTDEGEVANLGAKLAKRAPITVKASGRNTRLKRLGLAGAGAAIATPLIASMFRGKQDIDPQIQLQLAQAMGGGAGAGQGVNTSRTLIDTARLLSIIKGIQEMSGMGQGMVQGGGRLI